jgi:septal ring factor EnvC (AmiA/AmiB activator)
MPGASVVAVLLLVVAVGCSSETVSETSTSASERESDLEVIEGQLEEAEGRVDELEREVARLEAAASAAESDLEAAEARLGQNIEEVEANLRTAIAERDEAQRLAAQLTMTYSEEIEAARAQLTESFTAYACDLGVAKAVAGDPVDSLNAAAIATAFEALMSTRLY